MKKLFLTIVVMAIAMVATIGCGKDNGNAKPGDKGTFTLRGSGSAS